MEADPWHRTKLGTTLRSLRHRNYRLFFGGQGISLVGTWMQMVATSWLLTRLTGSPTMLGLNGFVNRLPSAIVTPLAGVMIDRLNRHRVVVWMQLLAMLQALLLASLALTGRIEVWQVLVLSAGLGVVNAIEVPARQSLFVELVGDKDDLPNAIALNSSLFNSARLVGPAVAGVLIAAVGEGVCFLLNGISYLAVIAALLAMRLPPREAPPARNSVLADLRAGFAYVYHSRPVAALLVFVALVGVFGMPYTVLLPLYAKDVLHSDSRGLGYLLTAGGAGALSGALFLAQRPSARGLERLMPYAVTWFGCGMLLIARSQWLWLSLLLMPVLSSGMMIQMGSTNTILQTIVPDAMRGRVMSLYFLAFSGSMPLGSLVAGYVARVWSVPTALALGGVGAILAALLCAPAVRAVWDEPASTTS
ncbi:MAG: MFS transporter [Fimbriimonadaceae bacterium]|nr:MFS transporter [Fimbriimonadaceae bacterium]